MSRFQELRLIDILSHVDISTLEEEALERDLENPRLLYHGEGASEERALPGKRATAILSGIAACGMVITGTLLLIHRKRSRAAA